MLLSNRKKINWYSFPLPHFSHNPKIKSDIAVLK